MIEPAPGERIYVDANAFIYLVEDCKPFVAFVQSFFERCAEVGAKIVTSELTIAECLYRPYRDKQVKFIQDYDELFDAEEIEIVELSGRVARQAAELGGALRLKLSDAIHYISAIEAGCSRLLSYDQRFRNCPGLSVLSPGLERPGN